MTLQTILINLDLKFLQMFLFMCSPTHMEHVTATTAIYPNTGRRECPPQSRVAKGKDAGSGKEREMWRGQRRRESGARGKKAQPGKSDYTGHHVSTTSYPTSETQQTHLQQAAVTSLLALPLHRVQDPNHFTVSSLVVKKRGNARGESRRQAVMPVCTQSDGVLSRPAGEHDISLA